MEINTSILHTAIEAAQRAGRIIAERYPTERNAYFKGYRDLVTETDVAAQRAILDLVSERFPAHANLSEESEESARGGISGGYTWVVDPLDGTSNFTHRVPIFSVSVGVLKDGEPLVGVVYDPLRDHLFVGQSGAGATLNGDPIHVSAVSSVGEAIAGFDWARDDTLRHRVLDNVQRVVPRAHSVRVLGSAALGLTYVATGWLGSYCHLALQPWDAAAAVLLVREAGGRCTTSAGELYRVGESACLATNGLIHDEMLGLLNDRS